MQTLSEKIRLSRPTITDSSIRTYVSYLRTLEGKVLDIPRPSANDVGAAFLSKYATVTRILNESPVTTHKNILTAILVALKSGTRRNKILIAKYEADLMGLNKVYTAFLDTQKKTPKQERAWLDYDVLIALPAKIKEALGDTLHDRPINTDISDHAFDLLQQLVILTTYLEFPIRNNYADMPIVSSDNVPPKENSLEIKPDGGMVFHIVNFKNQKLIGDRHMVCSPKLVTLIGQWLAANVSGYFLVKTDRITPMSAGDIKTYLNRLFMEWTNKLIGSSLIRHILISHERESEPTILQTKAADLATLERYHHSGTMSRHYRKI